MTTHTIAMTSSTASLPYPATVSANQDIAIGDTISLTMTVSTNTYAEGMSLTASSAYAVFTLINCTVSPSTGVNSGETITVTPINNNAAYSCSATITHYHASPYPPVGTTQTKTFVLSGAVGVLPIYGLEIFDANGNSRLRYDNRLCKFHSVYTGTISNNTTISVPGMAADGTWGINNQAQNSLVQCFVGTNVIALNTTSFGTGGNLYGGNYNYEIIVFRV